MRRRRQRRGQRGWSGGRTVGLTTPKATRFRGPVGVLLEPFQTPNLSAFSQYREGVRYSIMMRISCAAKRLISASNFRCAIDNLGRIQSHLWLFSRLLATTGSAPACHGSAEAGPSHTGSAAVIRRRPSRAAGVAVTDASALTWVAQRLRMNCQERSRFNTPHASGGLMWLHAGALSSTTEFSRSGAGVRRRHRRSTAGVAPRVVAIDIRSIKFPRAGWSARSVLTLGTRCMGIVKNCLGSINIFGFFQPSVRVGDLRFGQP
jgi:hypothetical protein